MAAGGDEKAPNDGAVPFPLVRLLRPFKPPPFPKPVKAAAGAELPLAIDVLIEKPLKPLKAPPPSV